MQQKKGVYYRRFVQARTFIFISDRRNDIITTLCQATTVFNG